LTITIQEIYRYAERRIGTECAPSTFTAQFFPAEYLDVLAEEGPRFQVNIERRRKVLHQDGGAFPGSTA